MTSNSLAMLTDSEIISIQALTRAISQQSNLSIELQAELHNIGKTLAADPDYLSQAIKSVVELAKTYPPIQTAYQAARKDLQSNSNHNRMCQDALLRNDNTSNSSLTIINTTQDIRQELVSFLSAYPTDGQAQSDKSPMLKSIESFVNRFFPKKSQVR